MTVSEIDTLKYCKLYSIRASSPHWYCLGPILHLLTPRHRPLQLNFRGGCLLSSHISSAPLSFHQQELTGFAFLFLVDVTSYISWFYPCCHRWTWCSDTFQNFMREALTRESPVWGSVYVTERTVQIGITWCLSSCGWFHRTSLISSSAHIPDHGRVLSLLNDGTLFYCARDLDITFSLSLQRRVVRCVLLLC